MTEKEQRLFNRIPKKYRQYIESLSFQEDADYDDITKRMVNNYIVKFKDGYSINDEGYEPGDTRTFWSFNFMLWKFREYGIDNVSE